MSLSKQVRKKWRKKRRRNIGRDTHICLKVM